MPRSAIAAAASHLRTAQLDRHPTREPDLSLLRRRLRKLTANDVVAVGVEPMKNEASAAAGLQRIIERWKGEDGTTHLQGFSQSRSTHRVGHPRAPGTRTTRRHAYGGPHTLAEQLCQGSRTGLPQPLTTNLRGRPVEPTSFFGRVEARPFCLLARCIATGLSCDESQDTR